MSKRKHYHEPFTIPVTVGAYMVKLDKNGKGVVVLSHDDKIYHLEVYVNYVKEVVANVQSC